MDAKTFIAEFEHIAAAPGGVDRLREMILVLAIQGDLLSQHDGDESAHVLLERVTRARQQFASSVNLKRSRSSEAVNARSGDLPTGWIRASLADLAYPQPGYAFKAAQFNQTSRGVPLIRVRDVGANDPATFFEGSFRDEFIVNAGDWLVAMDGDFRVAQWSGPKSLLNQRVCRLQFFSHEVESRFVCVALQIELRKLQGAKAYTTVDHLSGGQVASRHIPVPPALEQKRIVAKVDELMALCDKLEAQQQRRAELRSLTRRAACASLVHARPAGGLRSAWHRMHAGMGLWMDVPDSVDDVEEALGYLGCMGVLNGFDSQTNAVAADQQQRALPPGWRWTELGDLAEYITSGSRGWRAYAATKGDVFIRSQDIKHDELRFEDQAFVALPEKAEGKRTLVREGDLLMTITGANVGKCAQMPRLGSRAYVNQHVALVRVKDVRQTPFLHAWITNAHGGRKHLARFIYGDKPGLNLPQVAGIPVPLPPQEVQDRIVQNLRHYGELCGRLAAQLGEARRLSQALAQASVAAITGLSAEEHTPMKTPKTELISNLQLSTLPPAAHDAAPLAALLARHSNGMAAKSLWGASGLEIDAFYRQLKVEMAQGWIVQPEVATVREVATR